MNRTTQETISGVGRASISTTQQAPARPESAWNTILLVSLAGLGFVLRWIGLGFGLPELYHADEPIVVNHAMAYGTGDLNPHFFQIPPLMSYLLFALYGLYFMGGWLIGKFGDPGSFADLFLSDPTSFYLLGRFMLGVLPGTATIAAIYFLGKKVVSARAGLWAAAMMAVCFLPVRDSHYIYTDIPLALALTLALGKILTLYKRGTLRDYLWAGGWIGLCAAIKYNAALVGLAYLAAHLLRSVGWRKKIRLGSFMAGIGAAAAVFVLTNPFCLLDFSFFEKSFGRQAQAQGFVGWTHHLSYSLVGGMGGYALTIALAGTGLALYLRNHKAWILLSFVLPFYLGITLFGQEHDRYVLPLIPFLCVFLALAMDWLARVLDARKGKWVLAGFVLLCWFPMLVKSATSDWLFCQKDSRTQAKEWILSHVPSGTKIALDHTFYVPRLLPTKEQLQEKLNSVKTKEASVSQKQQRLERLIRLAKPGEKRYELYYLSDGAPDAKGYLSAEPQIPFDFEELQKKGVKVVVTHRLSAGKPHFDFWAQVEQHAKDGFRFSPYRKIWRDFSMEPQVRTGGAFLWPEMLQRTANGEFVMVYLLE